MFSHFTLGTNDGVKARPFWIAVMEALGHPVLFEHAAALANGGSDEGASGLRPQYHPNYCGSYVRDPDGNKLQAVAHASKG